MLRSPPFVALLSLAALAACQGNRSPGGGTPGTATPRCGNGVVDIGELCDPCPRTCDDGIACTTSTITGSGCRAECVHTPITSCATGDQCCPGSCNAASDGDCSASCGDGTVDDNETCDGDCMDCESPDACTTVMQFGSSAQCNIECAYETSAACGPADGCCPQGCTSATDGDCMATCGNGRIDPGELCDSNCPTTCEVGACEMAMLVGSAATCTSTCAITAITTCANGDSCCPAGCDDTTDDDCTGPTGGVGSPCRDQAECATLLSNDPAATCLPAPAFPDGFCTKQCATNTDCPSGALCQIELNVCLPMCDPVSPDCRAGYTCLQTLDVFESPFNACLPPE